MSATTTSASSPFRNSTVIRPYRPEDEPSWLRCRVLAFLDSAYFDDVWIRKPSDSTVSLVAVADDGVVAMLDLAVDGDLATIDCVGVHPDHRRRGLADALLNEALERLPGHVTVVDAWTRDDESACAWYRANGFSESDHYLHVYKSWFEPDDGWVSPPPLQSPVMAFAHAVLEHEDDLRARFARVHVCRRFSRRL